MSSRVQIRRRINGSSGAPSATGFLEGELALNFPGQPGFTGTPELWAHDGRAWRKVNDTSKTTAPGTTVVDFNNEPAAVVASDIGNAFVEWENGAGAGTALPRDKLVVALWGSPEASYLLIDDARMDLPSSWQLLGGGIQFSTIQEVLDGTDTQSSVNPYALFEASSAHAPPNKNQAEAGKYVRLNSQGYVDTSLLNIDAMQFIGTADMTVAPVRAAATPSAGDFVLIKTTGSVHVSWQGIAGQAVNHGDMAIYDGAEWHVLAAEVDLLAYLPLAGGSMVDGARVIFDTTTAQALPDTTPAEIATKAAAMIILDGAGGTLDEVVIDSGTY